ncbi:hypothetical protein BZA05DRAFT_11473 [Tricharina praecox]|uniref:uncharacterized protein n=1 Tax=Tricharina praecox TaxID=43433 RepID=UPI00221FF885|nr:uncharacterized protein BZA05DRAFT_11473 [Tricharina praecox]KAI5858720.1 hypothetical protein BZA05DRAFT_11473 [Tricharina praecox]
MAVTIAPLLPRSLVADLVFFEFSRSWVFAGGGRRRRWRIRYPLPSNPFGGCCYTGADNLGDNYLCRFCAVLWWMALLLCAKTVAHKAMSLGFFRSRSLGRCLIQPREGRKQSVAPTPCRKPSTGRSYGKEKFHLHHLRTCMGGLWHAVGLL